MLQVDDEERRTIRRLSLEQRQAHVVDRHLAAHPALGSAVMGVPVEDRGHGIAGERLLEPTRAEKRIDLAWLTLHRLLDRRVVQDGNALGRPQLRERRLELEGLVDGLPHESLDDILAPGLERALPEASAQPLGAGEAHAVDLKGLAVQQVDAGGGTGRGEERLEGSLRGLLAMQVPNRGQPHQACSTSILSTSTFSASVFSESMAAVHCATSSGVICPWGSRRPSA